MATTLEIVITGDEKGYTASVKRAGGATDKLGDDSKRAAEKAQSAFKRWQATIITVNQALQLDATVIRGVTPLYYSA